MADESENGSTAVQSLAEVYAEQADAAKVTTDIPGVSSGDALPEAQDPAGSGSTEPPPDATSDQTNGSTEPGADPEGSAEPADGKGSAEPQAGTVDLDNLTDDAFDRIMQHPRMVKNQDDLVRRTRGDIDTERARIQEEQAVKEREDAVLNGDQPKLAELQRQERTPILQDRLQNTVSLQIADGVHDLLATDGHGVEWTSSDRQSCKNTSQIFDRWRGKLIEGNDAKVEARAKEIADARAVEDADARRRGIPAPSRSSGAAAGGEAQKPGPNASIAEIHAYEMDQARLAAS